MKVYCTRCVFSSETPNINFDSHGVCNYCRQVDALQEQYGTGETRGKIELAKVVDRIKKKGKGRQYDCIIGLSGGTDSSYMLHWAIEEGLRPLGVHYDNTWNSAFATLNIASVTDALDVDLYTHVVSNKEVDDIYRAFMLAGVPEFDACTDIAFAAVLRLVAIKYKIPFILEGHSFMAEGISPQLNNYFDGKYVEDVHSKFGSQRIDTFPNLTLSLFMRSIIFSGVEFIRPLWYMKYEKSKAQDLLTSRYGWIYYGGHHLENYASAFLHTIYNPLKFGIDNRDWSLAAEARTGLVNREEAIELLSAPPEVNEDLLEYTLSRLNLTDADWQAILSAPKKSHKDFRTYKRTFKVLRPFFYVALIFGRIPRSFYIKYCR